VHVTQAAPGGAATMSVRAVTDGGHEIDRVDLVRGPRSVIPAAWRLSVPGHVGRAGEQELRDARCRGRDQADRDGHGAERHSEVHHMYIYAAAIQVPRPIR
jgi:hypothetical protein